ncbi:hypothetical protein AB3K92_27985 [Burkholderia sp. Bmkn7]|uniref:hypothetical protein n=1 Tax=Burkholderia sp. Bmkn7 TaxID=3236841 RepID=UPI0034E49BD7
MTTENSRADALTDEQIEQIARNHELDMPDGQDSIPALKAAIYEALDAAPTVEQPATATTHLKAQLRRAMDLLDTHLGDSDAMLEGRTPEEIEEEFPAAAAMQIIVGLHQEMPDEGRPAPAREPEPSAIPHGYALVPIEPTPKMIDAWTAAPSSDQSYAASWTNAYRAMLTAAFPPPTQMGERTDALIMSGDFVPGKRGWMMRKDGAIVINTSPEVTDAVVDVRAERRRQITEKGWTVEHDDEHACGEIAALAAYYAMPAGVRDWPAADTGYGATFGQGILPEGWSAKIGDDRRRELVKAGALILAEIERLDRAAALARGSR